MNVAPGVAHVRGAIDPGWAVDLLAGIDAHPAWRDRDPARWPGFVPTSSSLKALAVPGVDLTALADAVLKGEAGPFCREGLGDALVLDLDRCWVRRQYAFARRPPGHAAHSWHQDGALAFDFTGAASRCAAGALLPMQTCWIALTSCGRDAPGLEFVATQQHGVLGLEALADAAVHARHPPGYFVRPALEPGDALVFDGAVLHHTHVDAAMRHDRTSLELRFFDARRQPERLRGDRFLTLP